MAVSAIACAGAMCLSLAACGGGEPEAVSYVSLDINPSIELTLDKNDKVLSVYGANEDAQVLLYQESGIVGADVETAIEKITSLAVQLGYLDESNTVVETSVTGAKSDILSEELLQKVNAKVMATAGDLNLSVTCDGAQAYSLLRKLEQLKEKYPDSAAVQALTPEKLKLVLSATEDGSISVEAAAELDTSELINKVSDAHKDIEEYATAAYKKAKATASSAYDVAVGDVCDGIYTTYYTVHHPLNAYYGFSYQGYKFSARSLYAISDALVYAEKTCEYPLNEAQIAGVSQALGLGSNVDALKNSDGDITVNSIYAYADKTFKNSDAAAQIEQVKTALSAALDTVESQLQAKVEEFSQKYETQINTIKGYLTTAANSIESMLGGVLAVLPEAITSPVRSMVNDCKEFATQVADILKDGKITADEVRALAAKLDEKAKATLTKIESDLTKDEIEEVKKLQQDAADGLTAAKEKMENAISQAETQAKAKLEELKSARAN